MDVTEALKWYRAAAERGDALAQYNLGMRYYEGNGLTANPVDAFQWLSLAANQQMPDATKALEQLKRTMNRDQIAEGRRRVTEFAPKINPGRNL